MQYQTFLHGLEKRWSRWSSEAGRDFTNIPEGKYDFRVRAQNQDGQVTDVVTFAFEILPPWYRTWWAYALYLLSFSGILLVGNRIQKKRLIRREQEKTRQALLEAENKRREEELEKARQLQLSMLPKEVPKVDNLDIAVYMKTATEVGGDYYDFSQCEDGTLFATIGDATGHGINAGMVVTTTKSLFFSTVRERDPLAFYKYSNETIDELYDGDLLMALQLLRIKDRKLTLISGGMPPAYYYHAKKGEIEEILVKAMPLGAFPGFPYKEMDFELKPGDTLLFSSDGFAELFNENGNMFGYDKVRDLFAEIASKSSQEIIDELVKSGDAWRGEVPNDDDITFLVVKVKK